MTRKSFIAKAVLAIGAVLGIARARRTPKLSVKALKHPMKVLINGELVLAWQVEKRKDGSRFVTTADAEHGYAGILYVSPLSSLAILPGEIRRA